MLISCAFIDTWYSQSVLPEEYSTYLFKYLLLSGYYSIVTSSTYCNYIILPIKTDREFLVTKWWRAILFFFCKTNFWSVDSAVQVQLVLVSRRKKWGTWRHETSFEQRRLKVTSLVQVVLYRILYSNES